MFCSKNLMSLSQNLLWRVLKIDKTIYTTQCIVFLSRYKYCRKPSDDWRHETQCHGYLLLLITSYIHHIALFYIILSTLPEIVNSLQYSYIHILLPFSRKTLKYKYLFTKSIWIWHQIVIKNFLMKLYSICDVAAIILLKLNIKKQHRILFLFIIC